MQFLAEIPRSFTVFEADSQEVAMAALIKEATKVAEHYGVIEDITNTEVSDPSEAMKARNATLLNKVVTLFESAKNITIATGGKPFLGVNDADIVYSGSLAHKLGITADTDKSPYLSVGFLLEGYKKKSA